MLEMDPTLVNKSWYGSFIYHWNWYKVVDTDGNIVEEEDYFTADVEQIWVSEKVYMTGSGRYELTIHHVDPDFTFRWSPLANFFHVIVTDNALTLLDQNPKDNSQTETIDSSCLTIGRTVNCETGAESVGIAIMLGNGYSAATLGTLVITDCTVCDPYVMTLIPYYSNSGSEASSNGTLQLIPIAAPYSPDIFTDAKRVLLRRSGDRGEVILNGSYYFVMDKIAVPYTVEELED